MSGVPDIGPRLQLAMAKTLRKLGDFEGAGVAFSQARASDNEARSSAVRGTIDEIERGAGTHFDPEMARRVADYCRLNMGELRRAITFKR